MLTSSKMVISNAKKKPAILVEMEIPRTIIIAARAKKINVQIIHGTLSSPPTL